MVRILTSAASSSPSTGASPISCDHCRKNKAKCSKQYPCSSCAKKNIECLYTSIPKKRGPAQGTAPLHLVRKLNSQKSSINGPYPGNNISLSFSHSLEIWDIQKSSGHSNNSAYNLKIQGLNGLSEEEQHLRIQRYCTNSFPLNQEYPFIGNLLNSRSTQILRVILNNSLIDVTSDSLIFLNPHGDIEYLGSSPALFLVTNYFGTYHRQRHQGTKMINSRSVNKLQIPQSTQNYISFEFENDDSMKLLCCQAFFTYYNPTFPLLNPDIFYAHYYNKCPILTYFVCAAGLRYLSDDVPSHWIHDFDNLAFRKFLDQKFKPSVSICIVVLMMAQYLVKYSEFHKSSFYLGKGIIMAQMLGCNQTISSSRIPSWSIEMRKRIWWACCILDKLYAFGMNRHVVLPIDTAAIAPPSLPKLDHTIPLNSEIISRLGSQLCFRHMFTLSHLMGKAVYFLKQNPDYKDVEKLLNELEGWLQVQARELNLYPVRQIGWVNHILKPFIYIPDLIYHSIIIQLCMKYRDHEDINWREKCRQKYSQSAHTIVIIANDMKEQFIYCGVTYRFYCLTSAILVQVQNVINGDKETQEESKKMMNIGLNVLMSCSKFFPLATECLNIVGDLLEAEGVDPSKVIDNWFN